MLGKDRSDKSMKGKKVGKSRRKNGSAVEPESAKGYTDYYVVQTPPPAPEIADEPRGSKTKRVIFWVVVVLIALAVIGVAGPIGIGITVGVGLWFLMRYLWRKQVSSSPDSKLVRDIEKKLPPKHRKILAGAACVVVGLIFMLSAFVSQGRQEAQQAQSESGPTAMQQEPAEQLDLEVGDAATFDGYSVTIQSVEYDGKALGAAFRIVSLEDMTVDIDNFSAETEAGDAIEMASASPFGSRSLDRGEVLDGELTFEDGQAVAILWADGANRASWKLDIATEPAATGTFTAHFIDVGQGDASFCQLPDGKTMLVDAGTTESGSSVVSYLRGLGVETIDYLVATHSHEDHIGGMPDVFSAFQVGQVWAPRATHDTRCYEDFLNAVSSEGLTIQAAEAGKQVCSGGGCTVEVVAPAAGADPRRPQRLVGGAPRHLRRHLAPAHRGCRGGRRRRLGLGGRGRPQGRPPRQRDQHHSGARVQARASDLHHLLRRGQRLRPSRPVGPRRAGVLDHLPHRPQRDGGRHERRRDRDRDPFAHRRRRRDSHRPRDRRGPGSS